LRNSSSRGEKLVQRHPVAGLPPGSSAVALATKTSSTWNTRLWNLEYSKAPREPLSSQAVSRVGTTRASNWRNPCFPRSERFHVSDSAKVCFWRFWG
jgi:hypothetical protein